MNTDRIRKIALAAGGALALGLFAGMPGASAGSIGAAGAPLVPLAQELGPQDVRWVRVCRNVPRWWNGRRIWVRQCRSAWVGPRRHWW